MKRFGFVFFCLVLSLGSSVAAHAATMFDFTFTGTAFSGAGEFTATEGLPGVYLVTDATGSVSASGTSSAIASVLPAGAFEFNDNLLYYPGILKTYFDLLGVSFVLDNGAEVNLFGRNGAYLLPNGMTDPLLESVTIAVSPGIATTPEPSSLALLGTGVLAAAGMVRRKLAL